MNERIKKEFKREFGTNSEQDALEKKFRALDRNNDDRLVKAELRKVFDLRWWLKTKIISSLHNRI